MENKQVENQQKIAELQSAYSKTPKAESVPPSIESNPSKLSKSYFWPSFWSAAGMSIVTSIAANVLSSLPGLDGTSFFLYIAGIIGVYIWWEKMYQEKFSKKGFVWGVVALFLIQLLLGLILFFAFVGLIGGAIFG